MRRLVHEHGVHDVRVAGELRVAQRRVAAQARVLREHPPQVPGTERCGSGGQGSGVDCGEISETHSGLVGWCDQHRFSRSRFNRLEKQELKKVEHDQTKSGWVREDVRQMQIPRTARLLLPHQSALEVRHRVEPERLAGWLTQHIAVVEGIASLQAMVRVAHRHTHRHRHRHRHTHTHTPLTRPHVTPSVA